MDQKAQGYWEKSKENLLVWQRACRDGHFNAAASRYYYALRLAAQAFFETRKIDSPYIKAEFNALLEEELAALGYEDCDTCRFMTLADKLRNRGDYEHLPVGEPRLQMVKANCSKIWRAVGKELRNVR
jgi:uncharacterized protein (UPF0332 family)